MKPANNNPLIITILANKNISAFICGSLKAQNFRNIICIGHRNTERNSTHRHQFSWKLGNLCSILHRALLQCGTLKLDREGCVCGAQKDSEREGPWTSAKILYYYIHKILWLYRERSGGFNYYSSTEVVHFVLHKGSSKRGKLPCLKEATALCEYYALFR